MYNKSKRIQELEYRIKELEKRVKLRKKALNA